MLLAAALVFELARESLTGTHCRYREYVDGLPTDNYIVRPCDPESPLPAVRGAGQGEGQQGLRWVNGRIARREIIDHYIHDYDATTGELLRRIPLFFRAKPARVFDPNPVVTLNDPTLHDQNDSAAAVPDAAYFDVELPDSALDGPHVTIVDRQPRNIAPPQGALVFNREDDGFEDVNAYFHIDRSQRYLQSLGYTGTRAVAAYAVPVDAHAASGADNSFFLPSSAEAGRGTLFFGEGGTDDAEDADILVHEYTHAVHEWIAPGTFTGGFASEARALAEGIADYWAYSTHAASRRKSGRDPFCFADWDARCGLDDPSQRCGYEPGENCLRRLDSSSTMADYVRDDAEGAEHINGAIWASALREIHDRIGKRETDTIVIESLFATPPRPTFAVMAQRLLEADRLLYQGTFAGAICSAMFTRGILAQCDFTPRGERTHFQARDRAVPIPENNSAGITSTLTITDARAIENIYVRVDIAHSSRGDLRVELTAPDGTTVLLHQISSVRAPDIRETYGLTAVPLEPLHVLRGRSAAGVWRLHVSDRRPLDTGTLLSWGLVIQFAGDQPLTARPRSDSAQMIPVVAHLYGVGATLFRSDVRIANVTDSPRTATLIFTRSGEDGHAKFAAVNVAIEPGHTAAFDDVLETVFHTAGSGTLEVLGAFVVTSRTDGQEVPPDLPPATLVAPLPEPGARYNFGLSERGGQRGVVSVDGRALTIEPFSHLQFPVGPDPIEIRVLEGNPHVVAYVSQIGSDAMFIPAQFAANFRVGIAPVITSQTSGDPLWRSDLWVTSPQATTVKVDAVPGGSVFAAAPAVYEDVLARLFHRTVTMAALRVEIPAGSFAATRIVSGGLTQSVPLLTPGGPTLQHLLFVESSAEHRTNIGIVADQPVVAEVRVLDAAGVERERRTLATGGGIVQMRVSAPVTGGRAEVRFLSGSGRAYASVLGTDALYVAGR